MHRSMKRIRGRDGNVGEGKKKRERDCDSALGGSYGLCNQHTLFRCEFQRVRGFNITSKRHALTKPCASPPRM